MRLKSPISPTLLSPALYGRTAGQERVTTWLVAQLLRLDASPAATALLRLARLRLEGRPVDLSELPVANPALPKGPFRLPEPVRDCFLLAFPPAGLDDRLVDQATGGYGYAWLAVDLGEVDLSSDRGVMLELPFFAPPRRVFIDRYGRHPYARISLSEAGVDCREFAACLLGILRIAEQDQEEEGTAPQPAGLLPGHTAGPADHFRKAPAAVAAAEALSPVPGANQAGRPAPIWNASTEPARLFSSPLLAASLPEALLAAILREHQAGLIHHSAAAFDRVSTKPGPGRAGGASAFVSPNGFCEYFGAPRGTDLVGPGQRIYPARGLKHDSRAVQILNQRRRRKTLVGLSLAGGLLLGGAVTGRRLGSHRREKDSPPGDEP